MSYLAKLASLLPLSANIVPSEVTIKTNPNLMCKIIWLSFMKITDCRLTQLNATAHKICPNHIFPTDLVP